MRDGIGTAFVAGLLLVGVLEAGDDSVNHAKVGVKFAIGLVILVLVMANVRKERIPQGLWVRPAAADPGQHRGRGLLVAGPHLIVG